MRLRRAVSLALVLPALAVPVADAQQVREEAPIPALQVQGADDPLSQVAFGTVSFALDRHGYAALFEYSRDGRVRVLFPAQPGDTAPLVTGKAYRAQSWSPDLLRQSSLVSSITNRVPYVFVLTSNRPFDLSRFGSGKGWRRQLVPKASGLNPERLIGDVAALVLGDTAAFEYDFGYLAPRMTAGQQIALYRCTSRFAFQRDDYWSYHDLWQAVTPDVFAMAGYGVFASSLWFPGAWGNTIGFARLSPSCMGGPTLRYAARPALGPQFAAYAPVARPEPGPVPPPVDSALPVPPRGSVDEPVVGTPDWRSDHALPAAGPGPRGAGRGATQPVDPPASRRELMQEGRAERLARRPQSADEANLRELRQVNRIMRSTGLSRSEAEAVAVAERRSRERHAPGYDDLRRSWGTSERPVDERARRSEAERSGRADVAERRTAEAARQSEPTQRGASAPSTSNGHPNAQARGGGTQRVQ